MGADEGVLVSAREFGGSDTYATSQILARALEADGGGVDELVVLELFKVEGRQGLVVGGSDTYATSQILAAAIDTIGVEKDDVVMCGRQAIDGDTAQVGPQIAEKSPGACCRSRRCRRWTCSGGCSAP